MYLQFILSKKDINKHSLLNKNLQICFSSLVKKLEHKLANSLFNKIINWTLVFEVMQSKSNAISKFHKFAYQKWLSNPKYAGFTSYKF